MASIQLVALFVCMFGLVYETIGYGSLQSAEEADKHNARRAFEEYKYRTPEAQDYYFDTVISVSELKQVDDGPCKDIQYRVTSDKDEDGYFCVSRFYTGAIVSKRQIECSLNAKKLIPKKPGCKTTSFLYAPVE